jgi:hypothetical protein
VKYFKDDLIDEYNSIKKEGDVNPAPGETISKKI